MQSPHNPECFQNHMGLWMIESQWFSAAFSAVKDGTWKPLEGKGAAHQPLSSKEKVVSDPTWQGEYPKVLYTVSADGVAIVSLDGPMMKFDSKYGSANTLRARRALRTLSTDADVQAVLLYIDSPGGTSAGTMELANDVRATDAVKPVYAHIEDQGASAAYWVASQARRITANPTGMVGSIGTFAVLHDMSKNAEMNGVKVHVVSTGELKGAGVAGTPITDALLDEVQSIVDGQNAFFLEAVAVGRKLSMKDVKAVADGRMMMAADAKKAGLIDAVQSLDDVVGGYTEKIRNKKKTRAEHDRLGLAIRIQEAE